MHLLILLPLVDFRMGILVALAPPQAGIVASEDCLLPLPLALSWKVRFSFLNGVNFLLNAPHAVFGVE